MGDTPSIDLGEILVDELNDAVFLAPLSEDGVYGDFIAVNETACKRLGYSREELLAMNARNLNPSANLERVRVFGRNIRREGMMMMEAIHVAKDGTHIPVDVVARLIRYQGRDYVLSVARDLRESKKLKSSEALFGRLMDHSWDEIYVFNSETLKILQANQGALDNLGYSLSEIREFTITDIEADLGREELMQATRPLFSGEQARVIIETTHRRKNGTTYPVEVRLQLSHSEVPPLFLAIVQDITRRKETEARLNYLANFDSLTGLPNRSLFMQNLEYAMAMCGRTETLAALIFIDLDGFKFINDSYGHDIGDKLLVEVGRRLKSILRKTDFISRLGGDEFTVIITNIRRVEAIELVAGNLIRGLSRPYELEGHYVSVTPSLGVSIYPFTEHDDALSLIKQADTAMYQAKKSGKNTFQFYTASLAAREYRREQVEDALKHALELQQLSVHYQPRVDLRSMKIVGVEALMRWNHPVLGAVSPEEFIPVMDSTGIINDAGHWLIAQAFRELQTWCRIFKGFRLSINVSARQFEHGRVVEVIREAMAEYDVEAANLEVEITEGALISRTEETQAILESLRALGIAISLDDFGAGYSSLNYLKQFPISILKIDRSFVNDLGQNRENTVITETIINLAHNLNLTITAEGIETQAQLDFLQQRHCDEGQGYLFARPVAAGEISRLLVKDYGEAE